MKTLIVSFVIGMVLSVFLFNLIEFLAFWGGFFLGGAWVAALLSDVLDR